jgi:hypothetical protein
MSHTFRLIPKRADEQTIRDKAYPSEIAQSRPMMMPRVHCDEPDQVERAEETLHEGPSRCELFNRDLREGLGTGWPNNIDE